MKFINVLFIGLCLGILLLSARAICNPWFTSDTLTETHHTIAPHSALTIDLFKAGEYLMLECKLNGKSAYFLVDTGASFSIIHSRLTKKYDLTVVERRSQQSADFGGTTAAMQIAINAELDFKEIKVSTAFPVQDLSKMSRLLKGDSGVWITGIIGTDLLKRLGCSIDVGRKVMTFK